MYSDYSPQQQDKFTYEKMFFSKLIQPEAATGGVL